MPIDILERLKRKYVRVLAQNYFSYSASIIEWLAGVRVVIHSSHPEILDDSSTNSRILIVCNHRTPVDWMFAGWSYSVMMRKYLHVSFVLKNPLKHVPFFGWCAQAMLWIFLQRNRDQDIPTMKNMISMLTDIDRDEAQCVFIFPEGTDLSNSNITKSNAFAAEHGFSELRYVLYPKPAGFSVCLDQLLLSDGSGNGRGSSKAAVVVHDITIAYRDYRAGSRTVEASILKGEFPSEVHLWVDRYDAGKDIPSAPAERSEWLRNLFLEKERRLQAFYNSAAGDTAGSGWPPVLRHSGQVSVWSRLRPLLTLLALTLSLTTAMLRSPVAGAVGLVCLAVLAAAGSFFGGMDNVEWRNYYRRI
eukprot:gene26179-34243_t